MGELDPGALANEYLELAKRIDECENRQDLIKDNLRGILSPFDAVVETPQAWTYGPARVQWVKGRTTEKVDVKKLRKVLVLAGVDLAIIEGAFSAATTVSLGSPTLRISQDDGSIDKKETPNA